MPRRIDLDTYCAADHLLISPAGDLRGVVDDQLAAMGRSRRVILACPPSFPPLAAVAASGALVTLPSRVATAFCVGFRAGDCGNIFPCAPSRVGLSGTGATKPIPGRNGCDNSSAR